jgi:hypothetical protein
VFSVEKLANFDDVTTRLPRAVRDLPVELYPKKAFDTWPATFVANEIEVCPSWLEI